MSDIGKPERITQERIIALFKNELGYTYLGDRSHRPNNSNIEEGELSAWLLAQGRSQVQVSAAIYKLTTEARNPTRSLYENNQETYRLLRYGVPVKTDAGELTQTIQLIDWEHPKKNDFGIAEEVTLSGNLDRRPDLVLYVNGIAVAVIELKNSRISMGDGIRQNLSNQQPEFHPWFFSTVQLVMAGNDSEGLKYGTTLTPEKFFVSWKEDEKHNEGFKIDKYLRKMCEKSRLLELMRDFVLFDNGWKKLPRPHQYFAIKAAQEHIALGKGGIIWHTQGSGKSIVMVLLAKWILENLPNARIVVVTDRDELDKQIEGVFNAVGEKMQRTTSGRDLLKQLGQATPRLLCSLIHKFGPRKVDNFEAFIKDLGNKPSPTIGDVFVFVDECHRTNSLDGKLHRAMMAIMPDAVFVGFTGTPLLKKDRQSSLVFGGYIHTYKFNEGVEDGVILDLVYDARDIDQRLGSPDKIDAWFTAKTQGLNQWQRNELKKQWSTKQKVQSSASRMDRVVQDITFDFAINPRLSSGLGNAILVASSIYEACRYYELFQKTSLKGKCAVVTSYNPKTQDITKEETGANTETEKQFLYKTYESILANVDAKPGKTKTETFEDDVKNKFIKEPANMRLLIVVDKLLTGFDAPPCSFLYIDKAMQDHGLFQAICRTNRLDNEDKQFGTVVDYKDLFKKVEGAMSVYTSELDDSTPGPANILIQDRLVRGRQRLDDALEAAFLLCEPVEPPQGELQFIHHFCGNTELETDLENREHLRVALYKTTVEVVRAFANIADEMEAAGYTPPDIQEINRLRDRYVDIRDLVRQASGESLDLKPFEADMRHLIDTYIEADEPRRIFSSENTSLLDLIDKIGIEKAFKKLEDIKVKTEVSEVSAEIIENNIRKKLVKERLADPVYYETMSALLKEVIEARKSKAIAYEEYLKRIADLAKKANAGSLSDAPTKLNTPGKRALWSNLGQDEELALRLDQLIHERRPDDWRGKFAKEGKIKAAIYEVLQNEEEVERIFAIVKAQDEY